MFHCSTGSRAISYVGRGEDALTSELFEVDDANSFVGRSDGHERVSDRHVVGLRGVLISTFFSSVQLITGCCCFPSHRAMVLSQDMA